MDCSRTNCRTSLTFKFRFCRTDLRTANRSNFSPKTIPTDTYRGLSHWIQENARKVTGHFLSYRYFPIHYLSPYRPEHLQKIAGPHLVKKFPAFYGTRRFITAFTTARHLSLSGARSIHSMPPLHFLNSYFNIILPSTLGFSKWSLSFRFFSTTRYAPLFFLHVPLDLSLSSLWFVTVWCNLLTENTHAVTPIDRLVSAKNNHQRYLHMQNRKFHISTRDLRFSRQCCWRS